METQRSVGSVRSREQVPQPGRPLTRTAIAGLAAHIWFELGAGVGAPLASVLGPRRAAAFWTVTTAGAWHEASRVSHVGDTFFAVTDAFAVAALVGHLRAWPTRRGLAGVPWLRDCEGLGPELMPVYNSILYVSAVAGGAALLRENAGARRWPIAVTLASVPVLSLVQRVEFRRLCRQALAEPSWWTRRLAGRARHGSARG